MLLSNFLVYSASRAISSGVDQGVAHTLGLDTYRHGTNIISWLGIRLLGAQPKMGGSRVGGDYGQGYEHQNRGRFYMMKDADGLPYYTKKGYFKDRFLIRAEPWCYNCKSHANLLLASCQPITRINHLMRSCFEGIAIGIAFCSSAIVPSIKIRFSNKESYHLLDDHSLGNKACSTDQWIPPWHLGSLGTVWNGLSLRTPVNMYRNPTRVITGLFMVSASAAVGSTLMVAFPTVVAAHKTAIIAGCVMGML